MGIGEALWIGLGVLIAVAFGFLAKTFGWDYLPDREQKPTTPERPFKELDELEDEIKEARELGDEAEVSTHAERDYTKTRRERWEGLRED